ncbi:MAG: hypothetical protein DRJ03_10680 [Chloroflexi bacterium]|nr:MAG: hypothetical protein DRJ03_10680 [Chloroflexota bacterium]
MTFGNGAPVGLAGLVGSQQDGVCAMVKNTLLFGSGTTTGIHQQGQVTPGQAVTDVVHKTWRKTPFDPQGTHQSLSGLVRPIAFTVGGGA